jgi:hypothetical protein
VSLECSNYFRNDRFVSATSQPKRNDLFFKGGIITTHKKFWYRMIDPEFFLLSCYN